MPQTIHLCFSAKVYTHDTHVRAVYYMLPLCTCMYIVCKISRTFINIPQLNIRGNVNLAIASTVILVRFNNLNWQHNRWHFVLEYRQILQWNPTDYHSVIVIDLCNDDHADSLNLVCFFSLLDYTLCSEASIWHLGQPRCV